ncbi:MAG TPA: endonuclease MutS2 [Anaerolineales bacterium]|nr:endonuclease MutS2 [Anaerolineales bacterium]
MDEKTLYLLEYPKILERVAAYCAFPASAQKARELRPGSDIVAAQRLMAETSEATRLLAVNVDLSIGGARDVRSVVDLAQHSGTLEPHQLLDIKYTLIAGRTLAKTFERVGGQYPVLADIVYQLPPPLGIIDFISRAISDRGEILDSASDRLRQIRHDLRIVHDRLLTKLQRMTSDPKLTPYLQEALVTQRDGRYVIPLRAEFKGKIKALVHDQSSSGATLFVEPISVVEQNNLYRELQLAERDEERRILTELSALVGKQGKEILHTVEVLAVLDFALARARYSEDIQGVEPVLHQLPKEPIGRQANTNPGAIFRLFQARHPLLDSKSVVPIDVEMDGLDEKDPIFALVITGPNTGGKTVSLKTIGLLALMAYSGLHIPAHSGSEISVFENIYADIGDEQSIEQSLSTFSGHITNIIRILNEATPYSLVILDELGAGTDPQEGAALARSLLEHLVSRGITTLVTTHHPELKAYAHARVGVVNASVEFDLETLRPTFRLTIGLPGRSNALAIAQRLGLPQEIIADAKQEISPDDLRADDLLNEIHHQRELARKARAQAEEARQEAQRIRVDLLDRLEKIEDERRDLLEKARQENAQDLEELQAEIASVRRLLARARQPLEIIKEAEEELSILEEKVEQPVERLPEAPVLNQVRKLRRPVKLGDRVKLRNLGVQGVVTALSQEEAEIQVGVLRVRARLSELLLADESLQEAAIPAGVTRISKPKSEQKNLSVEKTDKRTQKGVSKAQSELVSSSPGIELDLRGRRADDALDVLDRYLDSAFIAGLPYVRIIHGKGTGRLREVVREALGQSSHVRSFESGGEKEGGEGVTVALLASG